MLLVIPKSSQIPLGLLFGKGAVATLSIPTRFVHSPNEIINKNDLEAGIKLLCKLIETGDKVKLMF